MTVPRDIILTKSQKEAIEELRNRMGKDLVSMKQYNETTMLYRFLRAREWNVNDAEDMLRKAIGFREQYGLNKILTDFQASEMLKEYYKNVMIGYDKERCPVYYQPCGNYDVNGIFKSVKMPDLEKFLLLLVEEAEDYLEKNCKQLNSGFVYIIDQRDLPFSTALNKKAIELTSKFFKIQQDIYPERLKAVYIINASPIFTFPFNIIKNFMAPRVLGKLNLYGTEGWQEDLLKVMDAEHLPAFLGGERTDPDGNPLCRTIVQQAGKVDEKYYIPKRKSSVSSSPGMKKIVVSRASSTERALHVRDPGSLIEWEFETKTRDIGFGLFYKETDGKQQKLVELVPLQRLWTEITEIGMYKCDKAGDYVILFDNSYSWMRSKEIYYKINVVNPKEHENRIKMD